MSFQLDLLCQFLPYQPCHLYLFFPFATCLFTYWPSGNLRTSVAETGVPCGFPFTPHVAFAFDQGIPQAACEQLAYTHPTCFSIPTQVAIRTVQASRHHVDRDWIARSGQHRELRLSLSILAIIANNAFVIGIDGSIVPGCSVSAVFVFSQVKF